MDKQLVRKAFGQELLKARNKKGISQEKLALDIGLHPTYISMLERGKRQPSLWAIFEICDALNISCDEFVRQVHKNATQSGE